ncbi:reverse transcriptase domain-containing protein [Acinetobacter sp. WCHA39]|uniref:reverse transcriptase domain-containing protein n=1 Tax=Acinetobacter sp. WCHA39 TaxID=2004648 RepID=UPI000B3C6CF5|nr:reverse transcriptase domain-containing protein [Acinetobacter sp. WCHA39]
MNFLQLQTTQDLANFFEIDLKHLMYLVHVMPGHIKYKSFKIITKKKERLISSPFFRLKKIQYRLKEEFEKIYKPRKSVYGFIKDKSIKENAINHLNKRYIFNIDLQDFFGSITAIRIKYLLQSYPFNFPSIVAEIISKLICYQGVLPQGSPCSPIISNMIAHRMDGELSFLAKKNNATYTRYVDDITFSFTKRFKALPKDILTFENGDLNVGAKLDQIINSNGFIVNQKKVRLGKRSTRMEVTGITVNEKLNVPRKYIRKIRTLLHLVEKYGEQEADRIFSTYKRTRVSKYPPRIEKAIFGMLTYLAQIVGYNNMVYYNLAKKYNSLEFKSKLLIIKPVDLQIIDALWVILLPTCEEGTAFSISNNLVVTAAHVVINEDTNQPFEEIQIYKSFAQDQIYHLEVLKYNIDADVAICKIMENYKDDSFFELGGNIENKLKLLGFPQFQPNQHKPHSADCDLMFKTTIKEYKYFSINTPIIGGNSGGPVIDSCKRVVGVASKGYFGQGIIDQGSLVNKSIHVTIMGHNLCSDIQNVKDLID